MYGHDAAFAFLRREAIKLREPRQLVLQTDEEKAIRLLRVGR
jgi:hypothetical protein